MAQRICIICGSEFTPKSNTQKTCKKLIEATCVICGKKIQYHCGDYVKSTCSRGCAKEYQKQLCLEKYGVDNVAKLQSAKDKAKITCKERYGTEYYTQTDEYRKRVKATSLQKYGTEHPLQAEEVIAKRMDTVREKYNVDNVFQSEEIKQRSQDTLLEKYGVANISQSEEIQDIIRQHNVEKYGVAHPMMLPEYKDKAIQTNIVKYGRKAYTQQHIKDIQAWYSFIENPKEFINTHYDSLPRAAELAEDLGVDLSTVDMYLNISNSKDCVIRAKSLMEQEVYEWIKQHTDTTVVQNEKQIIAPYELDLYLPELKLAIECNPTVTHNSSFVDPWGGAAKSHNYHKMKTDLCEKQGIFLFHIFGYEWTHKKPVIKSMLCNLLQANKHIIYARKCEIYPNAYEVRTFLDRNHRQGYANSSISISLVYQGKQVSMMTFGRMRHTIGQTDDNDAYELVRFCNEKNTTVVGGASKLFKYFIDTYKPSHIISFSDRAHTRGNLYQTLGFTETRRSDANYVWVDVASDRAYHRINAQKMNLKKFLKDDSIDLSLSEKQIMEDHKFAQVFDSGTITWEWYR